MADTQLTVNRDRSKYDQKTQALVRAIAEAYFAGDEDAAWERWFLEAEKVAQSTEQSIEPGSPALMWIRPLHNQVAKYNLYP